MVCKCIILAVWVCVLVAVDSPGPSGGHDLQQLSASTVQFGFSVCDLQRIKTLQAVLLEGSCEVGDDRLQRYAVRDWQTSTWLLAQLDRKRQDAGVEHGAPVRRRLQGRRRTSDRFLRALRRRREVSSHPQEHGFELIDGGAWSCDG
jgi:hypothetical protein